MLQIYNSLTRRKEPLRPIEPGKLRMYVCGMTVYDYCHIGHARVMVVFDTVVRYLRARGYAVTYVRNITDIDDKIIKRAAENGEDIGALTARFIAAMHEDERALGVLAPDAEPRATGHMAEIVAMIRTLIDKGHAYVAPNADVYYRVRGFAAYGALSGKSLDDLQAGARVDVDEDKEDPLDFVLWKAAKPGEPQWDSPWGPGRPGWHIECSAMSMHCLGRHFDIHGGGMDLKFPHHENEIAQSEAATGEPFVNLWMHNGYVQVDQEKMSKSLGNFFTVREVLARYAPEVVRYFILASHYRSPLDYSDENLHQAKVTVDGFYLALRGLDPAPAGTAATGEYPARFDAAMDDDFNTPKALAVLAALAGDINRVRRDAGQGARAAQLGAVLRRLGDALGLFQADPEAYLQGGGGHAGAAGATAAGAGLGAAQIEDLIGRRNAARARKDWTEADRIRAELTAAGVVLEDSAGETVWRRA